MALSRDVIRYTIPDGGPGIAPWPPAELVLRLAAQPQWWFVGSTHSATAGRFYWSAHESRPGREHSGNPPSGELEEGQDRPKSQHTVCDLREDGPCESLPTHPQPLQCRSAGRPTGGAPLRLRVG